MWRPLERSDAVNAFLKYTSLRIGISRLVEDLEADYCWRNKLLPSVGKGKISTWRLSELAVYVCGSELTWSYETSWFSRKPAPPINLKVVSAKLEEPKKIVDLLAELIQSKALETSGATYAAKGPIGRWKILLIHKLEATGQLPPGQKNISVNRKLLEALTWGDILELARSEPPSFLDSETAKTQLNIGLLSIPSIDLRVGSGVIEFGILFAMVYFLHYEREAFRFKTLPSSRTFFAVFCSSRSTRILFMLLISIPPLAAALLASKSPPPIDLIVNSCIALLTVLVSVLITIKANIAIQHNDS